MPHLAALRVVCTNRSLCNAGQRRGPYRRWIWAPSSTVDLGALGAQGALSNGDLGVQGVQGILSKVDLGVGRSKVDLGTLKPIRASKWAICDKYRSEWMSWASRSAILQQIASRLGGGSGRSPDDRPRTPKAQHRNMSIDSYPCLQHDYNSFSEKYDSFGEDAVDNLPHAPPPPKLKEDSPYTSWVKGLGRTS